MTGLGAELRDRVEALSRAGHVLVAMDFDGTLAPFVDRPDDARALPASARALAGLASLEETDVALISGRDLASLRRVAAPGARTLLVASHGAERYAPAEFEADPSDATLTSAQWHSLEAVRGALAGVVGQFPGAWVEDKAAGAVLHTRVAGDDAAPATRAAVAALDRLDGVCVTQGKDMVEAGVLPADKGQGLRWLRDVTDSSVVVFAGDDRTDEDAFAVLGPRDIGVKVGPGPTRAEFRVDGPGDVAEFLQLLLDVRG